jgi:hypothetical protein
MMITHPRLGSFSTDARTAIQTAPDYFVWWYTVKSVGLGVVAAALAFTGNCGSAMSNARSAENIYARLGFRAAQLEKAVRRVGTSGR